MKYKRLEIPELPELDEPIKSLSLSANEARVIRLYLERVARRLERAVELTETTSYRAAYRSAIRMIRASKPD